jgi:hypothetical protein
MADAGLAVESRRQAVKSIGITLLLSIPPARLTTRHVPVAVGEVAIRFETKEAIRDFKQRDPGSPKCFHPTLQLQHLIRFSAVSQQMYKDREFG